ncbi:MAG: hypothetical protein LQ340_005318 [Diploschistes diacapsis]|nr:MAG: hypothetical protein LQ340_005318 [Diploschistes diacapsis]
MADSRLESFNTTNIDFEPGAPEPSQTGPKPRRRSLYVATHRHLPRGVNPAGESHRRGFHPWYFLRICFRSSSIITTFVNILWPAVPAAIALYFIEVGQDRPDLEVPVFALNYVAMVPTANLIGFAGQQLATKLPKVLGVIFETFLGSIVEIILLMVLLKQDTISNNLINVIRDAILGSILANMLLCLGACFVVGGIRYESQQFDGVISEVGSGLLLTAGFGLAIPSLKGTIGRDELESLILKISRATSIILLVAFALYVWFQMRTHHSLFDAVLEQEDTKDRESEDVKNSKLTLTECLVALVIALALVSMHAVFLVKSIDPIVKNNNISDMFMGLILVPLVEKLAEHLGAVQEAYDNQMNFALSHVLGSTLQTALLNSSLVVLVGWGMDKSMDLSFSSFQVILLILSILVVGNFIRDRESNYLEGSLCILVYLIIAIATFYVPNADQGAETASGTPA